MDTINRQKVSVNTIVNSGFELEFNENIPYYDANGTAIAQPREEDFLSYYIDPVVVSYETKNLAFFPMERYAENLNTVNGMIVMLNRLMGDSNDKTTRDISTVQGMLNTLEDKLDKLEDVPGDSLVVTDQYGHLNGATITDQNVTGQDRAIITDPVEENEISGLEACYPDLYNAEDDSTYYYVSTDSQNNYYQYSNGTTTISVPTVTTGPNG